MIDQLEKSGTLQSIIDQAHQEVATLPADLGRGGNRGLAAFLEFTKGNAEDAQGDEEEPSFRSSMSTLLNSDEDLRSALEEQLVRRFPLQLGWNRKEGGPTVNKVANVINFLTGEILRRLNNKQINNPLCD